MTPSNDIGLFKDALLILGTAGVIVPVMHRLKISPILGFLGVGAALGPHGLGKLAAGEPVLGWFTVTGEKQISVLADMGIVFLLFFIGLELSLRRLTRMRHLVFGLGGLQSGLGTLLFSFIAWRLGQPPAAALIIGASLALSSTAIVIELLSRQRRMSSVTGRTSFAILLAQDLAVIPLLFLIGVLGSRDSGSVLTGILLALGQAAIAIVVIGLVGRALLRPLFRLVAATDSSELFMAATLLVAVGAGVVAALAGLSMALGAFIAGLLLAETEYRRAIEAIIEPFKGLLLGVFFFSVGMHIDLGLIWFHPLPMLAGVVVLIVAKTALLAPICRLWGLPWAASLETSLLLAPGGEFAFIGIGMAVSLDLVGAEVAARVLAVVSLTMAVLPPLSSLGRRLAARLETDHPSEPMATVLPPDDHAARVLVVGHGRVGQLVCDMLDHHAVPYLATDRDAGLVSRYRKRGRPIFYGDVSNRLFLERCGISEAAGLIITIDNYEAVEEIVRMARALRPDLLIVARARDARHAHLLYKLGVTDTVPETVEASLQLAESALVGLGVPMGLVIASIHERREVVRKELQAAAGGPGALAATVRQGRREAALTRDPD